MDLRTHYLGLELKNPLVPSSSPLSRNLDMAKRLEDAGAGALVMYSLFEEEVSAEGRTLDQLQNYQDLGHGEASSFLPVVDDYHTCLDDYLEQLTALKAALDIPVIASLNGISPSGWLENAQELAAAGADALELNVYYVAAHIEESAEDVEARYLQLLSLLQEQVILPITLKLSPQFSSVANMVRTLETNGADGVVLFNRFYQPNIDLDTLEVTRDLHLSSPAESLLAMRWIAILHGRVKLSLAATGGVHSGTDALRMLLAGADVTYLCSTLLKNGPEHLKGMLTEMEEWLEANEYDSVEQMKGSVSQQNAPDPASFERANYVEILNSYPVPGA